MRIKQILFNLLSNAVKYNNDNGSVIIEVEKVESGFAHISVSDTGIGISDKDQETVFEMFHRLGTDPKIAKEGTGIGLTITKLLVERMGGRIGLLSELDVGSTFWVELPITQ